MRTVQARNQPLDFLKLLAHDIRWRILLALSRSDHRVEELVKQIKQPHNLISYHLKRLRLQQLVSERRSSADARDIYYTMNLDRFREMYQETGQALHPGVSEPSSTPQLQTKTVLRTAVRVLFLCTHNSARSQMAEALLRELGHARVEVFSAGTEPAGLHPMAIKVMSMRGIDMSRQRSKHLEEYVGQEFDYVISVCDRVREVCPIFPGEPEHIHWSFADPVAVEGNEEAQETAFDDIARELTTRIQYLLLVLNRNREENR